MTSMLLAAALTIGLAGPMASAPWNKAQAWIDTPLPSSQVPLAPLTVMAHATDTSGVLLFALEMAGAVVATANGDGATLAAASLGWTPPSPGGHWLTVRARGANGEWGSAATVFVVVNADLPAPALPTASAATSASAAPSASGAASSSAGSTASQPPGASPAATPRPSVTASPGRTTPPTPTPPGATPTPTPVPTPVPTPRPTPVPCTPPAPSLLSPSGTIVDPGQNPPTFMWEYLTTPACGPSAFRLQVANDRSFTSIIQQVTVAEWSYTPSAPLVDCATYAWRVLPLRSDGVAGPASEIFAFDLRIGRCA